MSTSKSKAMPSKDATSKAIVFTQFNSTFTHVINALKAAHCSIRINKQQIRWLEIGETFDAPNMLVRRTGGGKFKVSCKDGSLTLDVLIRRKEEEYAWMDVSARPGSKLLNKAAGLLGSFDSNTQNDVAFAHGEVVELSEEAHANGYASFLDNSAIQEVEESWRVAASESLFSERHPASTSGSIGSKRALLEAAKETYLSPDSPRMERARQLCVQSGLTGAFIQTCAYDLAVTGDEAHIHHHLAAASLRA
mmetsp:Transcript_41670/g.69392  ORF Transcript_41670/g.69392 Transcript_41670/m.69392 type:complete len:250 (+) Transcript_41670:4192-4941(+)